MELALWGVLVLAGGLLLPGLGIVIGLVLAFTRLRREPPVIRWGLVALGVAVLALQIAGMAAWHSGGGASTPHRVT